METVNIMQNKEWFEKYKYDIPVLHLNGEEICRHFFDENKILMHVQKVLQSKTD
jgi:hypothetical protein